MKLDPFAIIASAQHWANEDTDRGFPWVVATLLLSHVRWYLQHGAAAAPGRSLAGEYCEGGFDLALNGIRLSGRELTPVPYPPSGGIAQ